MHSSNSEIAIGIRDLVKDYGSGPTAVRALKSVSLAIRDNEFFTLLGPSGCGKTSLLRIIAGFEQATGGALTLFGQDIRDLPPNHRPVNTVFQHYALFPHLSIFENIAFGLRRLNWEEARIQSTVRHMLDLIKLPELADRKPGQLSGGQQQRIALARALAPGPRVLLLDEPLSALDLKLRQAMRLELKKLQRETGITFVFVTHDQEEALSMSDRIAVLSQGEIQQVGAPEEIYENPANAFVADFIGEANFIDVRLIGREGGMALCQAGARTVFHLAANDIPQDREDIRLFLRPEKITLHPGAVTFPASQGYTGRIVEVDYLGNNTAYRVDIAGDVTLSVQMRNLGLDRAPFRPGDTVTAELPAKALHILEG